jgi:hypothetical protein
MLGREVSTPMTLLVPPPPSSEERAPWVDELHTRFSEAYSTVLSATRKSHRSQKAIFDRRAKIFNFVEGDQVWLYDPKPKRGFTPKLDANKWSGPYVVMKKLSSAVFLVKKPEALKGRVINVDRLAPYIRRDEHRFPVPPGSHSSEEEEEEAGEADATEEILPEEEEGVTTTHYRHEEDEDVVLPPTTVAEETTVSSAVSHLPLTTRARRQARRPGWFNDFSED